MRFLRSGRPYTLASIDIDHFKNVNDTWGHIAGDQVLVQLAKLIKSSVRISDTAARLGGEEFLLLLTDTELKQALIIAERLKQQASQLRTRWSGEKIAFTISIGVAQISEKTESVAAIMERVDSALYAAKSAGRNRVVVGHPVSGSIRPHSTPTPL